MNIFVTKVPRTRTIKNKNGKSKTVDVSFIGQKHPVNAASSALGVKWTEISAKDGDTASVRDKVLEAIGEITNPITVLISADKYYEESPMNPTDDVNLLVDDFIKHFSR